MKMTIFQLVSDPEKGFSIVEQYEYKTKRDGTEIKTGNMLYHVWIDDYEGGEAAPTDWDYLDEFKSFEAAKKYIVITYGKLKKLDL